MTVEPELSGLRTIEGSVPTPHGKLRVRAGGGRIEVDLPSGVKATVLVRAGRDAKVMVNGVPAQGAGAAVRGIGASKSMGTGTM